MYKHFSFFVTCLISVFYIVFLSLNFNKRNTVIHVFDSKFIKKVHFTDINDAKKQYYLLREQVKSAQIYYCNTNSEAYIAVLHGNRNDLTLRKLEQEIFKQNADLKQVNKNYNAFMQRLKKLKYHSTLSQKDLENAVIMLFAVDIANQGSYFFDNSWSDLQIVLHAIKDEGIKHYLKIDSVPINQAIQYLEQVKNVNNFDKLDFIYLFENKLFKAVDSPIKSLYDQNFIQDKFQYDKNPEKIALGNVLFYDPILSSNNKRACSSCHNPDLAFTDTLPKSLALDFNGVLDRNTPTIINSIYTDAFFHDMRSKTLPEQINQVILSKKEFGTHLDTIVLKLNKSKAYQNLFEKIYHQPNINASMITDALSAFVASQSFVNSEFDQYMRHEKANISESVRNGFNLFFGAANCATCHYSPTFSGLQPPYFSRIEAHNLGVPSTNYFDDRKNEADKDLGIFTISKKANDKGKIKTGNIRNASMTFPYMHNGVYKTLEEVITFYNVGGGIGLELDIPSQTLSEQVLQLSPDEKEDIINFIKSLNDYTNCAKAPQKLPDFEFAEWNKRKIGGEY